MGTIRNDIKSTKTDNLLERYFTGHNIALFYFFLVSIGLLGLSQYLSTLVGSVIFAHRPAIIVNDYLSSYFFRPEKKYELLHYIISAFLLLTYYIAVYLALYVKWKDKDLTEFIKNRKVVILALIATLFTNLVLLNPINSESLGKFLWGVAIWSFFLVLPVIYKKASGKLNVHRLIVWNIHGNLPKHIVLDNVYYAVLILVVIQFIHTFSPFVFGHLKMINEFLDIPERTVMQQKPNNTSGLHAFVSHGSKTNNSYVDNTKFINIHSLFGNYDKYDLEKDQGRDTQPRENTYMYLPNNRALQLFLANKELNIDLKYYFNNRIQALTIIDQMHQNERAELHALARSKTQRTSIDKVFLTSNQEQKELEIRKYSEEEKDFYHKNKFELYCQILSTWVIHHHNFILGPVNEYALGKKLNDIYMQYGWLNVVAIKIFLDKFWSITYQNYIKVLFSFYYIYYALFLVLLFILFRRIDYILLSVIISFSTVNKNGFNFLFLAPGFNPMRHFFDIIVIVFFYYHLKTKKRSFFYFALLASLVGILNNTYVGLFCLIALLVVTAIMFLTDHKPSFYGDILPILLSGFLGLYLLIWGDIGREGLSKYYLEGLLGYRFPPQTIISLTIAFSAVYACIPKIIKINNELKYIALFLFFYSQMLLLYYVWGATSYHFLNFAPIYALTVIIFLKLLIDNSSLLSKYQNIILGVCLLASLITYVPSLVKYYREKAEYDEIFKTHLTYEWDFDNAKFTSTMNPKFFSDAAGLIGKYSRENGIYIISKYDGILPFLSKRYSAMPFFEVNNFLVTSKEIQLCIDTINKAKPEYLFVDTDINRNLNTDIINDKTQGYFSGLDSMHEESVWRVQRLNLLKIIFHAVRDDYQPIEKGYLVTVYRKK